MITKFNYQVKSGIVTRSVVYSFTGIEELSDRLTGIDNTDVITSIVNTTLKGETERALIEAEDSWFKVQTLIQDMDVERVSLETKLSNGDKYGNPLTPEIQKTISARIAELKEGTLVIKKEFYNHYTRQKSIVDEVIQTPYTIALLNRSDLESKQPYLSGLRGVTTAPARPTPKLDTTKETSIRKELVRQKIDAIIGDDKDLIADMSNALSALIKKVSGSTVTASEESAINKYVSRQVEISKIMSTDYTK